MIFVISPGIAAHFDHSVLCLKAQFTARLFNIRIHSGNITGAALGHHVGNGDAIDLLKRVQQFLDARAAAGTEVEDLNALHMLQLLNGEAMAPCEVANMNIVAKASAILCFIVIAEDSEMIDLAGSNRYDTGHQIVGDIIGVLSDQTALMRTDGVKVAQKDNREIRIGLCDVTQDLLGHPLCPAVGGGGRGGELLGNGILNVVSIEEDCDHDTLLIKVNPVGSVCHTGTDTCFGTENKWGVEFFRYLQDFIQRRHEEMPKGSYTTSLFESGVNRMAQKVGEEAVETVIEATNGTDDRLIYEASDMIYHLIVLLTSKGHRIEELAEELVKRHKE